MLKNLKYLFVEPSDETADASSNKKSSDSKTDNTSQPSTPSNKNTVSSSIKTASIKTDSVDTKIIEKLLEAIEKNNLEGFDYLEYKKALKALDKMPIDEPTKYRSAFATASTMGVTLEKLIKTSDFYVGILDKENEKFVSAFKNELENKVSGRKKEIVQFEEIIKEKSAQITKLTEEITQHQKLVSDLKEKITISNDKIVKTQNDFEKSYSHLKKQFEDDILKMQKYLK